MKRLFANHTRCFDFRLLAVLFSTLVIASCSSSPHLEPSETGQSFSKKEYSSFQDYIAQTKEHLKANKVFIDDDRSAQELSVALPFELAPDRACPVGDSGGAEKGILLIHGLSDTPFAMRDLAQAFADRCFLVRVLLLPGHGTRPGDLLSIQREEWLEATHFALDTLKPEVSELYVGGFSLGGLLAVHTSLENSNVKGVFAFSPALALSRPTLLSQSVWLRHVWDWVDTDPPNDYARYEAMPTNGIAETYLLSQDLRTKLEKEMYSVPIFLAQSADDAVIDTKANLSLFEKRFSNPASRLISYKQNPEQSIYGRDKRIKYINSYLPEENILGFSHQSVHIAPNNEYYGENGEFRNCDADDGVEQLRRCLNATRLWRGETFNDLALDLGPNEAIVRLTYNPHFEDMLSLIDEFLDSI